MSKRKSKLLLLIALSLCTLRYAWGQAIVEPLDRVVALAGEIKEVHGYGPPGYGEDKKRDAKITYLVLVLPTPINILCKPERPEWASEDCGATDRLRLFFPTTPANNGLDLKAKALKGRKAIVSAMLHRQDTAGEMTPIYMNVTEIEPVKSAPSQ
jgi:hypothetical protein